MKLADYLRAKAMRDEDFAALAGGAFSTEAVRKWRFGARTPRPEHLAAIIRLTDGAVTPNDFLDLPSIHQAAE